MKKIDTSAVTSSNWLALLANAQSKNFMNNGGANPDPALAGIDFLQQSVYEGITALCEAIIYDDTKVTILWTIPAGANEFSGWVYYHGEIYFVPAANILLISGQYVKATITTSYSTSDPTPLSGSGSANAHVIRTIVLTKVTGSPGSFDMINWVYLTTNSNWANADTVIQNEVTNIENAITATQQFRNLQAPTPIGEGGFDALTSSYTTLNNPSSSQNTSYTTPNDGINRTCYIVARVSTLLVCSGSGASAVANYQISVGGVQRSFTKSFVTLDTWEGQQDCILTFGGGVAPNTVIALQGQDQSVSGGGTQVKIAELNVLALVELP